MQSFNLIICELNFADIANIIATIISDTCPYIVFYLVLLISFVLTNVHGAIICRSFIVFIIVCSFLFVLHLLLKVDFASIRVNRYQHIALFNREQRDGSGVMARYYRYD